ncbi:TENX-like protein [Mya arenaria]|uniref:protein-tyrosine-phosphatase n=1 Tax=Mya arenaria TaxID=6604 RepID=A0ABY7F409_MYAAR|nr:TENX-like protein [Mya arenaria]
MAHADPSMTQESDEPLAVVSPEEPTQPLHTSTPKKPIHTSKTGKGRPVRRLLKLKKTGEIKMADGSTIIAITTIILSFVVQTWCQDCLPCSCCKLGTACSGTKDGIDNYCLGGCMDGYMSSQCQKPCVNKLCQRCSKSGTCDTCYDNYYGEQCTSKCPSTCKTCTSSNSCTSCKDGYHNGSETTCLYPCKTLCLSCSNSTSCTACKVRSGVGYYGSDCSIQCSNKCKAFLCDINGNCLQCDDPNFKGDNCDRCVDGKYGNQCKKNCPVNCISCESDTHCTSCTDEFTGITCSTRTECPDNCYNSSFCLSTGKCESCKDGLYGEYCNMTCSRNCRYGYCNQDGSCKAGCKDGFNGSMCEIKICPPNCTCNTSNNCIGCNSNYFGPSCSLTCSSCKVNVCPVDRLNAVKCDECADGKYGNLCNESCPKNCLNDSCNQDGSCKSGCEDRFNGSRCEQRICPPNCTCNTSNNCIGCKSNYFGPSCSLSCSSCKDIICPVDRINAVKCDECADGKYGNLCNERCSDNCLNNRCDQDSGACTCENEYKFQNGTCVRSICPANCSTCTSSDNCTSCVDEYYHGDTCEHECSNCRSGTTCGKSDGYCQDECADGFSGYYCSTPCNDGCDTCTRSQTNECRACRTGRHGYDGSYYTCSNTCNYTCANNSCDALNGQCDQGCVDGYFGPFCNISCASNCKSCHHDNGLCDLCAYDYWGEYCLNNCSENCTHINESLSSCDIASGKCKYGCQHGTHGSLCSIECDQKCIASESGVRECRHTDGQCTQGCITGYKQGNTGCIDVLTFSEASVGARTSGAVIGGAVGGVVALLATALIWLFPKRRMAQSFKTQLLLPVFIMLLTIRPKTLNLKMVLKTILQDENKEDRSPDCQDTIVITKASTGQSKTKKLRNSAGRSEQLENSVKGQTPIKDASNDITHNKDTGDVYYNMNEVAVKDLGLFVATKDKAYFLEEFKKLPEGPTEKTMQDYSVFWRMIWQQKVGKIVMLTNLVEDGKPKCDQYWPDHGTTKQYGEIHVTCLTEDMYADFLMLTFSVKMDKEDRAVQHLHFTSWPDKGVPDDVTSLVDFRHRVLQTKSPLDGPTLVHCSTPVTTEGFTAYLSDSENEQRQIKQFKSYKQRKKFVLAMTPLDETVADFLCLTIQETAACIVDMENDSSLYIPDVGTQAKFGSYTVDNLREKSTSYSVNRVLRISYNGRGGPKEHTVSHYEYTGWPDNAEVPESAKNFLHLVKEVETKSASGSVIAHCKTGGGRCGMFAAVWTILEKTGIEHEVSIFNTVRQLRARRPNALCTSEQYSFCYECVREYLQTFDIYSNFS